LWARASADDRVDFAARLEAHLQTLKTWTDSCRYNFEPLYLAVRGEHARVLGETAQAGEFFEQAIASARAGNFTHVEAIACELAMKLWSPVDPARASAMQVRALAAYESWGAVRKVRALRAAALRS
jgi:hypothetical protein